MEYLFIPAALCDAETFFTLIRERIHWMDKLGIKQWNKEDYWNAFPKSYYYQAIEEKRLYLLREKATGRIVCGGVMAFADRCWEDDGVKAMYLHNFVTALNGNGIGSIFLKNCEEYGRITGKQFLRLDCTKSNLKLNQYYEEHGYRAVGQVIDGPFIGVKREKELK